MSTPSSSVDQIKSKLDIVSVVGTYVTLEKTGGNFKGRCPFHNEKTPSFFVSPDRSSYYCFGCHAKGDIFTFVQELEGLDFVGALKVLADRAGVDLKEYAPEMKTEKDALYSALELATFYFQKNLSTHTIAMEYLLHRGLTSETISRFTLGYAPLEWRGLYDFLLSKKVTPETMLKTGLVKQKEGTESYYDTFRGRIIFPISDTSGRVVGFSGRILVDDGTSPKYLNSPETQLFNKSQILYGLDKAKTEIRHQDYTILVEGQIDLVMLHQVGYTNTVASSGTALSSEHLTRLSRLSNKVVMAFDGDLAGINAVSRAARIALSLGMEVVVAHMPQGRDPADLAKDDSETLKQSIAHASHVILFVLETVISATVDPQLISRKVVSDVLPFVASLHSASEQSYFIGHIASRTNIKEEALWSDLKRVTLAESGVIRRTEQTYTSTSTDRRETIARKIIGILWWQKSLTQPVFDCEMYEQKLRDVFGAETSDAYSSSLTSDYHALLFETEAYYNNRDTLTADLADLFLSLEEESVKIELVAAMSELHKAEALHDAIRAHDLLTQCQTLSSRLNALKQSRHNV